MPRAIGEPVANHPECCRSGSTHHPACRQQSSTEPAASSVSTGSPSSRRVPARVRVRRALSRDGRLNRRNRRPGRDCGLLITVVLAPHVYDRHKWNGTIRGCWLITAVGLMLSSCLAESHFMTDRPLPTLDDTDRRHSLTMLRTLTTLKKKRRLTRETIAKQDLPNPPLVHR